MSTATGQDSDCDGLIDNSGFADQTFDCWVVTGARYFTMTAAIYITFSRDFTTLP